MCSSDLAAAFASAVPEKTDQGAASPQPTRPSRVVSFRITPGRLRSTSPTPCRRFMRNGQRTITERRFFPGYVLVEMDLDDDTWHLVKQTNKVTGFVGGAGNRPSPISEKEVEKIMAQMQEGVEKPKPKVLFEIGESVRVKEGPFTDFHGSVEDVNYDKSKLRVSVTIFGRATPVELEFGQVEKA